MPVKVFNFLPTPLNTANDASPSGFANLRTLQQTNAGGLVLGDAIDLTDFEAAGLSSPDLGVLFEGRYRRVQVAATATAANVGVGKAAFVNPGTWVLAVLIATPGSGQTPGAYQVMGTGGGGGAGAIIQVVVGTDGTVSARPKVVAAGSGYTSAPTFTLSAGGTAATFQAQMIVDSYIVTDAATAGINLSQGRGVFLNSITPGNYGWIQENGIASFLSAGAGAAGSLLTPNATGLFAASAVGPASPAAFATSIDVGIANALIRGLMTLPVWNG